MNQFRKRIATSQFAQEVKALASDKSRTACEYCGCNHEIRIRTEDADYVLTAPEDSCHQYIRDIHSEIRAIRKRLNLEDC